MKELNHPTIIKYQDAFIENKNLYIVTDFANGGDLKKMIRKQFMSKNRYINEKTVWKIIK